MLNKVEFKINSFKICTSHRNVIHTHVCNNGQERQALQNIEPYPDALRLCSVRSPPDGHEFEGVQSDFDDVVEKGKEGRQGKGGDKEGDEAILDHCVRDVKKTLSVLGYSQ